MTTEDDLRTTLRDHEQLAPEAAPVAARIRDGVRTRRRRHRYAGTAVVAVATVAAVAVPTVVLRDARPGITAAAPAPRTTAPAATRAPAPTVRFDPLALPFTVGWLPRGWYPDGSATTFPGIAIHRYEDQSGTGELAVQVWDTRVSGKDANDVAASGTTVRRPLGGNLWLAVGGTAPAADLDRVLRSVKVGDTAALTFPFRLTWIPDGYRVTGATSGVNRWVGNSAGDTVRSDPVLLDGGISLDRTRTGFALSMGVSTETGMWEDKGLVPNGTLDGHPSYYALEEGGTSKLHVYGVDGMHISIYADARPELDRAALTRIVRGLRLVGAPNDPARWVRNPLP